MHEDVLVTSHDGTGIALEQCRSLVTGETRSEGSQRDFSTRLYCSDEWEPVAPLQRPLEAPDPLNGTTVVRFNLDGDLVQLVSDKIFGGDASVEAVTTELSEELTERIAAAVSDRVGAQNKLKIRRRLKPIASLPSAGLVAGGTTDGLHLDARQRRAVMRVGLNLGSASRYVICGLTSLRLLQEVLGTDVPASSVTHAAEYEYSRLIDQRLRVVRFEVPAGFGWMMETTNVLHDGRRAHPALPSRFVLMEAEVV